MPTDSGKLYTTCGQESRKNIFFEVVPPGNYPSGSQKSGASIQNKVMNTNWILRPYIDMSAAI